jgi:hypothetical protein
VRPRAPDSCVLTLPASTTAGSSVAARVRVFDSRGNVAVNYTGSMTFTASDARTALPAGHAFTESDAGAMAFLVGPRTAGTQTVRAVDAANRLDCSATLTVTAASARVVVSLPETVNASHPVSATLTAQDEFGNAATTFAGSVALASSDAAATVPATVTFTAADAGVKTAQVTFNTRGGQTLTATTGGVSTSDVIAVQGFVYTDPSNHGRVRLVVNQAASSASVVQLDLVNVSQLIATSAGGTFVRGGAYSAGMNLPLDVTRVTADATLLVEPPAAVGSFNLGTAPKAAAATLAPTGVLYSGVSQKAAGAGGTNADVSLVAGRTLYSVRLLLPATATAGTVFDGANLDARFRAAVRSRTGDEVFSLQDFNLGKLEVR